MSGSFGNSFISKPVELLRRLANWAQKRLVANKKAIL